MTSTLFLGLAVFSGALFITSARARRLRRSATRLEDAFAAIDAVNSTDPNADAEGMPKELVYGRRMTRRLDVFWPEAPVEVKIACRAQHVARWRSSRAEFPEGKAGYLTWRRRLYKMHAEITVEILNKVGTFSREEIEECSRLIAKTDLTDEDGGTVEDVAALVFLEHYFPTFTDKFQNDDKLVDILRKTWKKMSERGRKAALGLNLPEHQAALVGKALSG